MLVKLEYNLSQLCIELSAPKSTVQRWINAVIELKPQIKINMSGRSKLYNSEFLVELKLIATHGITAYREAHTQCQTESNTVSDSGASSELVTTATESLSDGDFDTVHESIEVLELDTLTQTYTAEFQELAQKELEKARIEEAKAQARADFRTKLEAYNAAKNVESAKQRIQAAKDAIDSNSFLKMIGIDSSYLPGGVGK